MDSRISDYIKSSMLHGMPIEQIKSNLLKVGWLEKDVNEAISSVSEPRTQAPRIDRMETFSVYPEPEEKGPAKNPFKISTPMILIGAVVLVVLILFLWWFFTRPVCGNGEIEKGETMQTCCQDTGCLGQQTCSDKSCIEPTCSECQYLDNHTCYDYACCTNDQCSAGERCIGHECIALNCSYCQYILNHSCTNYVCCNDTMCNDNNATTVDSCINPRTLSAACSHSTNECNANSDCNDNSTSTIDLCSGTPKRCSHDIITNCTAGDNYCPSGCNMTDTDCRINCGTSLSCFVNARSSMTLANATETMTLDIFGVNSTSTSYFEIKSNISERFVVYFRYENASAKFTQGLITLLNSSAGGNYSLENISVMEAAANANATSRIGAYGTCKLNSTLFNERFVDQIISGGCSCSLLPSMEWNCTTTGDWLAGECEGNYFCYHA